jgi:Anti-sigma factor NepR
MKSRKPGGSSMDSRSEPPARPEGHLSKEIQASIGSQLIKQYQKIVEEGVPDRFADLLQRFDQKLQDRPAAAPIEGQDSIGHAGKGTKDSTP